jgi:hypothetical protein
MEFQELQKRLLTDLGSPVDVQGKDEGLTGSGALSQ